MKFLKVFGDLVRTSRIALGYTQEMLAEKTDISPRHIPDIEAGKRDLHISLVIRLATCLNIDLNILKVYAKFDENGNYRKDLLV